MLARRKSKGGRRSVQIEGLENRQLMSVGSPSLVKDVYAGLSAGVTSGSSTTTTSASLPNGLVLFSGRDLATGSELWVTDGSTGGTSLLMDIYPGSTSGGGNSSSPASFTVMNGVAYFLATDATSGRELWRSDGTSQGTWRVKDIGPGTTSLATPNDIHYTAVLNNNLYFWANDSVNGLELWRSDGTDIGTQMVADLTVGGSSRSGPLVASNGNVYFTSSTTTASTLWKANASGISAVTELSGITSLRPLADMNGLLMLSATMGSGGYLYRSDGTSAGTYALTDSVSFSVAGGTHIAYFAAVGNSFYFSASTGATGAELWKSDGTLSGTTLVSDLSPGTTSSSPLAFQSFGDKLIFSAIGNSTLGRELYITDGSSISLLADISAGSLSGSPSPIAIVDGKLYFAGTHATLGQELYITDGTTAGTYRVSDINPGGKGSSPQLVGVIGKALLFSADDGTLGRELYHVESPLPPGPNAKPIAVLSAPTSGDENAVINLSGTSSSDPDGSLLAYQWDFNYDGVTFTQDATGATPTMTLPDGPATRTIALRVVDDAGDFSDIVTHTITVNNVAPTLAITGIGSVNEGASYTVNLSATNIDSDPITSWTINWGDGSIQTITGNPTTASHVYADNATYNIRASVTDDDGTHGGSTTLHTVTVNNIAPTASQRLYPSSIVEGSTGTISLSGFSDPSSVDTAAGFRFSYDFNGDGTFEILNSSSSQVQIPVELTNDGYRTFTMTARIADKNGSFTQYFLPITVTNAIPGAVFGSQGPILEGTNITIGFSQQSDPSPIDHAAGYRYEFDLNNDNAYEISQTTPTTSRYYSQSGVHVIRGRIIDKDGGARTFAQNLSVINQIPTATINGLPTSMKEGDTVTLTATATDPSPDDVTIGFSFRWTVLKAGVTYSTGVGSQFNFTPDDQGVYDIQLNAIDRDSGSHTVTQQVTVANVAPIVTITNLPTSVIEGNGAFASSSVIDPGLADQGSSLTYAWTVLRNGVSYTTGSNLTLQFIPNDQGTYAVTLKVTDKDGAFGTASGSFVVTNKAPQATFAPLGTIREGSPGVLAFTQQSDATGDMNSLTYAFDFNNDGDFADANEALSSANSRSYTWTDSGNKTVRGRIQDKDGAFTDYTITVPVANVAPTATLVGPTSGKKNKPLSFTLNATDPSSIDLNAGFTWSLDWDGNGSIDQTLTGKTGLKVNKTFTTAGVYNVTLFATDKDGTRSAGYVLKVTIT